MLSFFVWDYSKVAFILPYCNVAVYWYSIFFAFGLFGSLLIGKRLLKDRATMLGYVSPQDTIALNNYSENLFFYIFLGVLIGARLGHVLFYDLNYYKHHLLEILNLRQGGLSSHGGVIGILTAFFYFERKKRKEPFLPQGRDSLDLLAISAGWAAFCIRCGNFVNQEIIGNPSTLPWAIIFTDPVDGISSIPRHPTQLYEALVSLTLLGLFLFMGRGGKWARKGKIAGLFLVLTFTSRFFIEMVKAPQCPLDRGCLHMGQLLSVPLVILGVYFIISSRAVKSKEQTAPHQPEKK
jgi:phosphatidylglycerol---prolipoprotein diacylglyceryl transferase